MKKQQNWNISEDVEYSKMYLGRVKMNIIDEKDNLMWNMFAEPELDFSTLVLDSYPSWKGPTFSGE